MCENRLFRSSKVFGSQWTLKTLHLSTWFQLGKLVRFIWNIATFEFIFTSKQLSTMSTCIFKWSMQYLTCTERTPIRVKFPQSGSVNPRDDILIEKLTTEGKTFQWHSLTGSLCWELLNKTFGYKKLPSTYYSKKKSTLRKDTPSTCRNSSLANIDEMTDSSFPPPRHDEKWPYSTRCLFLYAIFLR